MNADAIPFFLTRAVERDMNMSIVEDRRETSSAPQIYGKRAENNIPDRVATLEAAWRGLHDALKNAEDDITDLRASRAVVDVSSLSRSISQKPPLVDIAVLAKDLNYGDMIQWAEVLVKDITAEGMTADKVAGILFKWAKKASSAQ